ncbi:response regulator transcription factor [Streptoverticillium reticulum]|uniref:helix-turn-helix transcriptional regulator n=1 Tax=Streptoverticillium reticulum TaxID=1433415 RepID=UPI0039BFCB41
MQLRARDYERMLDLAVAVLENGDTDTSWHLITGHLLEAFGCHSATYTAGNVADGTGHAEGWAPERLSAHVGDLVQRRIRQRHPLFFYTSPLEPRPPVNVSEICARWRHTEWYSEARRDFGAAYQMGVPLPGEHGILRNIVLGRDADYTARELAFATRIQPLLVGVANHVRELRRLRAGSLPAPVMTGHGLTPRELTVLGLLAEGLTTEAIARRLAISPHTVNRHLEKVYRKLGTNNRVSTVRVARRAGLVA